MTRWAGRTALVTGASNGVGREIARSLAADGAKVLLPVRDRAKGQRAIERIRESVPSAVLELHDLDLARLASIRGLAAQLMADGAPIHLFVMNAGIIKLGDPQRHLTEDGFELHFQTNFLGHVALTQALLPLLTAGRARIVVQGSLAAARTRLDWDDLQLERRYTPLRAYSTSKLALGLYGLDLARRLEPDGITVQLCHPGVSPDTGIAPDLRARKRGGISHKLSTTLGNTPAQAALPALMALASDASSGRFFAPSGFLGISGNPTERRLYRTLTDADAQRRISRIAEELLAAAVR